MSSNKKVKVATHVADLIKPRKKYFYPCYCVRCKGTEVDSRTQERHTKDKRLWKSKDSRKNQSNAIAARKQKNILFLQMSLQMSLQSKNEKGTHQVILIGTVIMAHL